MSIPIRRLPLVVTAFMCTVSATALADQHEGVHPLLSNKFYASAGVFFPDRKYKFGLSGSAEIPDFEADIDFSETFKLKGTEETGSFEIGWRFGKKWLLRAQYFGVDSSTTAVLDEDIEWGNLTFNSGSSVGAGTDFRITRLFVGRKFHQSESREFGVGFGAHMIDAEVFIRGEAIINGMPAGFREERAGVSQPLPNIGAWYVLAFNEKWAWNVRLDWLAAKVDQYDGHIINAGAGLTYAMTDHFGVGVSYNFFEIDVEIDKSSWKGAMLSRFDGAYLYLSGYW